MDTAVVAERTGAKVVGGTSAAQVGRGHGLPDDRLVVVTPGEPLTLGAYDVTLIESEHCPPDRFPGVITEPVTPPVKASAYKCGESWSTLFHHRPSDRRLLVVGSAGFVSGALAGQRADVVYLGVGQLGVQPEQYLIDYWTEAVRTVGARRVVLIHWDDFFRPLHKPLRALPYAGDDLDVTMRVLTRLARGGRCRAASAHALAARRPLELTLALVALAVVLLFAIMRPHGWPEAVVAIPAAALLIASGVIPMDEAAAEVNRLLPVVGFLAAILVLARLCDDEGLFHAAGVAMARISAGRPKRLLAMVFVVASATTAILSLDATVVLLTPVVLATARSLAVPARPHAYATAHLANTASLLLPVSNLTNLLAFTAAGLSFLHFAAVMTLPWLAAIAVEFLLLRWLFARDLSVQPQRKEVPRLHRCRCSCWLSSP